MRWLKAPGARVWLIAAGVIVLCFALYARAPEFLKTLEAKSYDLHFAVRGARSAGDQVVIVAVDEKSLAEVGRWPWPRSVMARLVDALAAGGARVIALDILFSEPEVPGEGRAAARIAERLDALGPAAASPAGQAVRQELEAVRRSADHDGQLAEALRRSGRAVLPVVFEIGGGIPGGIPEPSGSPLKSVLTSFRHYGERGRYPPPSAVGAAAPVPALAEAAHELGHVTMLADFDGATRWEALVFEHRGHYYPSLAVQAARMAAGVEAKDLRLDFGRAFEVGPIAVPVDPRNRTLVDYAGPPQTFRHIPAADLLAGRAPAGAVRDRIVFVGTTAAGTYDLRVTPTSPIFPGVEKHATVAANILSGRFLKRPDWVELLEAGAILLFPLGLAWMIPRLRPTTSLAGVVLVLAAVYAAVHAAFRTGLWLPVVYPSLAIVATFTGITVYRLLTEERQRLWIKHAFQRFVSPEVVDQLVQNPAALRFGGEVRNLTVLFSDIRDFTTYTERHEPEAVVQMLREYLSRMVDQILPQKGTIDKFIGDAIMAIFGAPVPLPDHPERACRAALAMARELEVLQARWAAEGREPFRMGIGINTADMVVGNLGSEQLFDYTVTGDGVNLGARLESLNKEYDTKHHIIISESTYEAARDKLEVRRLGEVKVKGKTRPVVIYELLGMTPEAAATAAPHTAPLAAAPANT
jgi:adenylate cyclase